MILEDAIDWKKLLLPYEQAVAELEMKFKGIDMSHRKIGDYSPIESVCGRVKNISSIIKKAERKHISLSEVERYIDDIAGVRIVTKFVEDIAKVVLMVRARDGGDLEIVEEKDYVNNKKKSGYRSYHIIIKYSVYTPSGIKKIRAEIQIRTLAMNFWATIEHSLRYKYHEKMPERVRERLTACAEASYKLDDEMTKIRSEIIEAQKILEFKSLIINNILENIDAIRQTAKVDEAENLHNQFLDLYKEDDLEKMYSFNKQLSILKELYRVHGKIV